MIRMVIPQAMREHQIGCEAANFADNRGPQSQIGLQSTIGKVPRNRLGANQLSRGAGFFTSNGNQVRRGYLVMTAAAVGNRDHANDVSELCMPSD